MFSFLCNRLLLPKWKLVGFIQTPLLVPIKSFSSSSSSKSVKDEVLGQSFTVSYLINSCGLPLERAISVSQKVHFETPKRPDSVLTLLRDHGFTESQVTRFVVARPGLLMADPEKTLLPKLKFFLSIGLSNTGLSNLLSANPSILENSLENRLMPWYDFLKTLLLDDKIVAKAIKKSLRRFNHNVQKNFAPNILVLREHGVAKPLVLSTVRNYPFILSYNLERFDKMVKEVLEMGFDPKKTEFVHALVVFLSMSKSTRENKMELYRRWGWSEDDVQLMLKKCPLSMILSEKKITSAMDFLVNKMGCKIDAIARYPLILRFNLEKRIIPRCLVIKVLLMKGFIKKDLSLATLLSLNKKHFQDKFVTKYQEDFPQLLNVYQGKMSLLELGVGSEEICGMKQM